MRRNYQLVYQSRVKCEIYRDTGVSNNRFLNKCPFMPFNDSEVILYLVKDLRKEPMFLTNI